MSTHERVLYQFPLSHYCEKARWTLDAKRLSYALRDVVPGAHILTMQPRLGARTVPVLVDQGKAIADSTSIALHLEVTYPDPPLFPAGSADRSRAFEIEEYFDRNVGPAVRRWIYGQLMVAERGSAATLLFGAYPLPVRLLGKIAAPMLELALRKQYRIDHEGMARSYSKILEGADRIEAETGGDPSRYLAGDALSIADITAASLLAPLVAPPSSAYAGGPSSIPEPVLELRAKLRARPAGEWVMARYERDRAETNPGSAFQRA